MFINSSDVSCGVMQMHQLALDDFTRELALAKERGSYEDWSDELNRISARYGSYSHEYNAHVAKEPPEESLQKGYTYIFSDVTGASRAGTNIAKYIRRHRLGTIISTPTVKNPNSGNKIRTWLWIWNGKVPKSLKGSK